MFSLESRLRRRLLVGVLLVSIVLAATVRMKVHEQQSNLLNYQLEQVARALMLSDLQGTAQTWDSDPALHLDVQIWDAEGMLLYRSSDLINVALDTPPGLSAVRSGHQSDAVKLKVFTLSNEQRTVQVMHAQNLRDELRLDAELEVLIPAMLVMLVGAILVTMTIRKELEPIRELDAELSRRDADSLQPVALPQAPAELASVVRTLNHLLLQLESSLLAHKRFIANAAHELRTPIAALSLEVDNLLCGQDHSQMLATAARLKLGTQRAQHLLQQMLTLARLEARTQPRPRVTVNLQQLAQQAMMDLSALASHRAVEFELDAKGSVSLQADSDELRLLLDNLLGNALKFSPPGGIVKMSLSQQGQGITLELRDNGPGIAPDLRDRILLPFVRVDTAIEGAGLGLSIVQEVVQNHGATLLLETPPDGNGLLVRVNFPGEAFANDREGRSQLGLIS
jgi:two-component system OmpR family sensor kinase